MVGFPVRESFGEARAIATGMPKTGILKRAGTEFYYHEEVTDVIALIHVSPGDQGEDLPG